MATQNNETLAVSSDVSVNTNENTFKFGGSVSEFTGKIKKGLAAQEAALNEVMELLKFKNITKEEHERLWSDAYEKAICLLDYKVKMGKLIAETESASGKRTDLAPHGSKVSKQDIYKALGLTKKQANNYQLIAKNPEAVEKAKIEAIEKKDLPSVYRVLKLIRKTEEAQKPSDETPVSDAVNPVVPNEDPEIRNKVCVDLPEGCDIQGFIEKTMNTLKVTEDKNTYIYFQVLPHDLKSSIEVLIGTLDPIKQIGICVDK